MRKHWPLRYRPWAYSVVVSTMLVAATSILPPAGDAGIARAADASMDAATGYRIANYRSPVTLPVDGGARIALADLDGLRKDGALLLDVMPARAGYDDKTGRWRLVEKRLDIPESVWLPNVGQGKLEPRLEAYFVSSLRKLTGGNPDKPIVFYCMADCWMSWNAVKRAASFGYRKVYWYAEGTDGWTEAGRTLVTATPPPVPAATDTQATPAR